MRKVLVSLSLVAAALNSVPAAAQYHPDRDWRGDRRWDDDRRWDHDRRFDRGDFRAAQVLMRELDRVENRIHRSFQRGFISRREAFGLQREAERIRVRIRQSARFGLSRGEFQSLRFQIDRLERHVRHERRDFDGRRF
ncbi:MAG: hypothetical protein ACT4OE_05550 [Sphingosinicella sp.]